MSKQPAIEVNINNGDRCIYILEIKKSNNLTKTFAEGSLFS